MRVDAHQAWQWPSFVQHAAEKPTRISVPRVAHFSVAPFVTKPSAACLQYAISVTTVGIWSICNAGIPKTSNALQAAGARVPFTGVALLIIAAIRCRHPWHHSRDFCTRVDAALFTAFNETFSCYVQIQISLNRNLLLLLSLFKTVLLYAP